MLRFDSKQKPSQKELSDGSDDVTCDDKNLLSVKKEDLEEGLTVKLEDASESEEASQAACHV